MQPVRSILVAYDGSPPSIAALDHAVALAEGLGANVEVFHVVTEEGPAVDPSTDEPFLRARDRLVGRVHYRTVTGEPIRAIVETAGEGVYDLVVMGTHGRIGRLHSFLGSVAEGVVRNAPCPVLTVREPGAGYQSFAEHRHGTPSLAEQAVRRH